MAVVKTTSNGNVIAKHLEGLAYQLSKEKPGEVRRGAARAINRATASIKSKTSVTVSRKSKLPKRLVNNRLLIPKRGRATSRFLNAKIYIYHSGIPWISLAKNAKGGLQESRIKYKGRKGSKTLSVGTRTGGRQIERGFTNVVGRKKILHVMARKGRSRYPIELPRIFIHEDLNRTLIRRARRTFRLLYEKELERELRFRLEKQRK